MDADAIDYDYDAEDESRSSNLVPNNSNDHTIALRLSATVKDPLQGFKFGRNPTHCDLHFDNDVFRRLSNIHFRIFIDEYGLLSLEDQSTNGTIVDELLLKSRPKGSGQAVRNLQTGSKITLKLSAGHEDITFLVLVPRRTGEYGEVYRANLEAYRKRLANLSREQETFMSAGSSRRVSRSLAGYRLRLTGTGRPSDGRGKAPRGMGWIERISQNRYDKKRFILNPL